MWGGGITGGNKEGRDRFTLERRIESGITGEENE